MSVTVVQVRRDHEAYHCELDSFYDLSDLLRRYPRWFPFDFALFKFSFAKQTFVLSICNRDSSDIDTQTYQCKN